MEDAATPAFRSTAPVILDGCHQEMIVVDEGSAGIEVGEIYWNRDDQLRQIVGIRNRVVEYVDLIEEVSPRMNGRCGIDEMKQWAAGKLPFQVAMSIRDMLKAAKARLTTRQRSFLVKHFPLRTDQHLSQPPFIDLPAARETITVDRLLLRGVITASPIGKQSGRRLSLTQLRGLPLVRSLHGHHPLHDILKR